MVRVVNICAPDLIALANLGFEVGTVISAAGLCSVCLPYFPLAYWLENQITLLPHEVLLVEERFKRLVQTKSDVDVAVRFFADLVHGARYRNARFQDLEPAGIVDIFPEVLIALCSSCLWGLYRAGVLLRVQRPIHEDSTGPNNQKYYDRYHSFHGWKKGV